MRVNHAATSRKGTLDLPGPPEGRDAVPAPYGLAPQQRLEAPGSVGEGERVHPVELPTLLGLPVGEGLEPPGGLFTPSVPPPVAKACGTRTIMYS